MERLNGKSELEIGRQISQDKRKAALDQKTPLRPGQPWFGPGSDLNRNSTAEFHGGGDIML